MTRIPFILLSTSDGSPLTGATPSVTISKDGAAFTAATNTPAEIGNGYYYVDLTTAETTVNNNVIIRATATGAQPTAVVWEPEQTMPTVPTAADNATAVWAAQTKEVTIATAQAATFATASSVANIATVAGAIKAKTDNLPQTPAAVGSAMTLTEATVLAIRNGLATITATDALAQGLNTLANHGDTYWSTADVSGLSTFNAATDAVTLTDAYDAAKTASQLTTSDLSALATSSELTALASVANDTLAGMLYWRVVDDTLITYSSNGSIRGQYTITKDSTGNIIKIEPIPSNDGN